MKLDSKSSGRLRSSFLVLFVVSEAGRGEKCILFFFFLKVLTAEQIPAFRTVVVFFNAGPSSLHPVQAHR